jgi:hypothetical protein
MESQMQKTLDPFTGKHDLTYKGWFRDLFSKVLLKVPIKHDFPLMLLNQAGNFYFRDFRLGQKMEVKKR